MRILIAAIISFIALASISFADGTYYTNYSSESSCENSCPTSSVIHAHCNANFDSGFWDCYRQASGGNTCGASGQKFTDLQPASSITLSNGCLLTISSLGTVRNFDGTFYKPVGAAYGKILYGTDNQPKYITTDYSSSFACGVGPDDRFINEWRNYELEPSWIDIYSRLHYKVSPPRSDFGNGFGYELTAGGSCKILSLGLFCSGFPCPVVPTPIPPAQKITVQIPDAQSSLSLASFKVGECLSNDLGDTSIECYNLYLDGSKPVCDTASTNLCQPLHHCSSSDPATMCQIVCGQVGQVTTVDSITPGYWKLVITSQKSLVGISDHPNVNLNSRLLVGTTVGGSEKCLPKDDGGVGQSEQCSINNLVAETYYIKTESVSGTSGIDFTSVTCTLGTPTLNSPSYAAVVDTNPKIEWSSVEGARTYRWEVREEASVNPSDAGCYFGTYAYPININLGTNYFWTAKACSDNSCTNCGSFASESKFVTGACDRNDLASDTLSSQCVRNGNQYLECDLSTYTCKTGACTNTQDACFSNSCCESDPEIVEDVNLNGFIGDCVDSGSRAKNNKYLCTTS